MHEDDGLTPRQMGERVATECEYLIGMAQILLRNTDDIWAVTVLINGVNGLLDAVQTVVAAGMMDQMPDDQVAAMMRHVEAFKAVRSAITMDGGKPSA
jgi:hypothetical protein